jgi:hypothetical protein
VEDAARVIMVMAAERALLSHAVNQENAGRPSGPILPFKAA